MAYDPATYRVNLDTPQPDGRKGESPRNAFTKYNALVEALKNAPPAPTTTTTNNIPQWSNTTGSLKDGLGLSTSVTLAGDSNSNVPTEKAVKAYVDALPGLIVSSGSNANGEWVKFTDGTQICYYNSAGTYPAGAADGQIFRSDPISVTYPASFVSLPTVTVGAQHDVRRVFPGEIANATTSGCVVRLMGPDASASGYIMVTAIGRWK